jgi:hypothetical protein
MGRVGERAQVIAGVKIKEQSDEPPYLHGFINDYAALKEQVLWSQEMPAGSGRPSAGCAPIWPIGMELKRTKRISLRWLTSDRVVRISMGAFSDYLRQQKVSVTQGIAGLKQFYRAKVLEDVTLAGGVPEVSGGAAPEPVFEIAVQPGTWLEAILDRHATIDDDDE